MSSARMTAFAGPAARRLSRRASAQPVSNASGCSANWPSPRRSSRARWRGSGAPCRRRCSRRRESSPTYGVAGLRKRSAGSPDCSDAPAVDEGSRRRRASPPREIVRHVQHREPALDVHRAHLAPHRSPLRGSSAANGSSSRSTARRRASARARATSCRSPPLSELTSRSPTRDTEARRDSSSARRVARAVRDVLAHGEVRKEIRVLVNEPEGPPLRGPARDVGSASVTRPARAAGDRRSSRGAWSFRPRRAR